MEYRELSGIRVSRLCFGSLTFSQARTPAETATEILLKAYRSGVNFIDTAQFYDNYELLRDFLSVARDMVIASKTYAHTADGARKAVEQARAALNRDVIDIFLLHEQESEHTLRGHLPALEMLYTLKARGVIRAAGLSTHHVAAVRAAADWGLDVVHPIINLTGFGIADGTREDMEAAIRAARAAGVGVYGMKALGGGNLFSRARECLDYVLSLDSLDSIAIGMRDAAEVEANTRFFETGAFAEEHRLRIESLERRLHIEDWCAACGKCVTVCKSGALLVNNGILRCNADKCRLCGYCGQACENLCIKII